MKILYVHERFGALAGAEANVSIVASELGLVYIGFQSPNCS